MTHPRQQPPLSDKERDILEAKRLLEDHDYVVFRMAEPGWQERAFRLGDEWVAFRLHQENPIWIKPAQFCKLIGIDRHTLTRNLKHKDCPKIKQERGPKGRLVRLEPTQALKYYLRRFK